MGAQSRNDIINIKIEEIEDERMADQLKTIKNEELLRKNIIVAIGKSKLWLKNSLIGLSSKYHVNGGNFSRDSIS